MRDSKRAANAVNCKPGVCVSARKPRVIAGLLTCMERRVQPPETCNVQYDIMDIGCLCNVTICPGVAHASLWSHKTKALRSVENTRLTCGNLCKSLASKHTEIPPPPLLCSVSFPGHLRSPRSVALLGTKVQGAQKPAKRIAFTHTLPEAHVEEEEHATMLSRLGAQTQARELQDVNESVSAFTQMLDPVHCESLWQNCPVSARTVDGRSGGERAAVSGTAQRSSRASWEIMVKGRDGGWRYGGWRYGGWLWMMWRSEWWSYIQICTCSCTV